MMLEIHLKDQEDTRMLGYTLASLLQPGDIVILTGELGAGKTTLVQGLARGLGIGNKVSSPTFVLIREYQGRYPLFHVDLYRLEGEQALEELGLEEYWERGGITVIEWGERLPLLPSEYLRIRLEYAGAGRRATLEARGERYQELLEELRNIVSFGDR